MFNRQLISIAIVLIALVVLFAVMSFNQQAQNEQTQNKIDLLKDKSVTKISDEDATPVVDYEGSTDQRVNVEQNRFFKNARYDDSTFVLSDPPPNAGEVIRYDEGSSLSDIPIDQSTIILEGEVSSSIAFLSNDKSGVYSEFTVFISKVIKNNYENWIKPREIINAERFGGRVRYPSGKIIRYKIAGKGFPSVNSKYLFFLSETQTKSYKILTAYELRDNKVFALDGARTFPRKSGNSIFDTHNEQDYQSFINEIDQALKYNGGK